MFLWRSLNFKTKMRKFFYLPDVSFNDFFTFLVMTNMKESTQWELQYQGILITASDGGDEKDDS
jgi:hypothetical protein